ncbi:MAG: VOC family protein [Methanobrevibacter sp.]|nr:VOC family protein [Methanobrevibacter sp.]
MKFKYTTILVKDMGESIEYYTNNFGFDIEKELNFPDKKITFLINNDSSGIELIEENNPEIGLYGIVFEVDDLSKEIQKLKENNPDIDITINKTPNNTLAFIKDPNGVNIILSK